MRRLNQTQASMLTLLLAPFLISGCWIAILLIGWALMACCASLGLNVLILPISGLVFIAGVPLGFLLAVRVGKWFMETVTGERDD